MTNNISDLDVSEISYAENAYGNKLGGKNVYMYKSNIHNLKNKLQFCISSNSSIKDRENITSVAFDMRNEYGKYSIDLSINDPKIEKILDEIDNKNNLSVKKNFQKWFGKTMNEEMIDEMHSKIVRKNERFPSIFKCKLSVDKEAPTKIYTMEDDEYKEGSINDIERHDKVLVIVESSGLWYTGKMFGMTFYAKELILWKSKTKKGIDKFMFPVKCMKMDD